MVAATNTASSVPIAQPATPSNVAPPTLAHRIVHGESPIRSTIASSTASSSRRRPPSTATPSSATTKIVIPTASRYGIARPNATKVGSRLALMRLLVGRSVTIAPGSTRRKSSLWSRRDHTKLWNPASSRCTSLAPGNVPSAVGMLGANAGAEISIIVEPSRCHGRAATRATTW